MSRRTHPSGNVPSTWISYNKLGTSGRTCRRPSISFPSRISSATECCPSLIRSWSCEAMRAIASVLFSRTPRARRCWARNPAWVNLVVCLSLKLYNCFTMKSEPGGGEAFPLHGAEDAFWGTWYECFSNVKACGLRSELECWWDCLPVIWQISVSQGPWPYFVITKEKIFFWTPSEQYSRICKRSKYRYGINKTITATRGLGIVTTAPNNWCWIFVEY